MSSHPQVTILIASRNRPQDLLRTLTALRRQTYDPIELLVIDDGSDESLQPVVRKVWPGATFVRHEISAGQCQRRSEGFQLAAGDYILQLDDDSYPVEADAVARAVQVMTDQPEVGLIAFHIYNGAELPEHLETPGEPRYTISFVGCGALMRRDVLAKTGGYTTFYRSEWEEEELSLRIIKAGFALYFLPDLLIHHHLSQVNRNYERTWARGVRNKLWGLVMHFPFPRIVFESAWVLSVGVWDSIRLVRFGSFCQALWQFSAGLGEAVRLRHPMDPLALRRYDALRFKSIRNLEEWMNPPRLRIADLWGWIRHSWWNRARQRSVWDRRPGDVGRSKTVTFRHEHQGER